MKKIISLIVATLFLFTGGMVFAQGMGGKKMHGMQEGCPGFGMGPGYGMMRDYLALTDEQEAKIHKINKDYADKFFEARKDPNALSKVRESHRQEIEKVLTKEQIEKLKNCRAKDPNMGMGMGKHGMHGPKDGMGPNMMHDYLKITDEQAEKIHKLNMDFHDQMFKNRKNPEAMQKLRENHIKEFEKILTKEQLEKLKEFRKNHPNMGNGHGPDHEWMW